MSSKYQKPLAIPEGFPALLKGFTREILRAQPDNIYEFGARYFQDLLKNGQTGIDISQAPVQNQMQPAQPATGGLDHVSETAAAIDIASLTPAQLEPLVLGLFMEADKDGSGYLDRFEFTEVLKASNLNLSQRQVRAILAEADENEDNVIQYKEFLPVMVDLLQSIKAKEHARSMMESVESVVRAEVESMLLKGMSKDELEGLMLKVFQRADTDASGQLSRQEFKAALKAAELGLTRKDINHILSQVDLDRNSLVSYKEFIPICFQILVERFKDEIVTNDILNNNDGLQGMLLKGLQAADPQSTGTVTQHQLKSVLKDLSFQALGLSTLQLITLISQAPVTPDGMVQYIQFVPMAATMILSMYDVDGMKLRLQAIKEVAAAGGVAKLSQLNLDELRVVLESAFQEADPEGTGLLGEQQVVEVLTNLGTLTPESVQLTEAHMRAMFAAIDANASGTVDWTELVNFICDAIEHMEREQYIEQLAQSTLAPPPQEEYTQPEEPGAEDEEGDY